MFRKAINFCLMVLLLSTIASAQDLIAQRRSLMPVPQSVVWGTGRLAVTKDFRIAFVGNTEKRLRDYAFRAVRRLEGRTVIEMSSDYDDPARAVEGATLQITTTSASSYYPNVGEDESYKLEISSSFARLTAPTTLGSMRGLETFLQLLESDKDGFYFPAVTIEDKPRFPWRGLMIDSARHFQPIEVIRRNLDAMAAVKLNVLHWHLTEDQGFRVETTFNKELYKLGSDGNYYTQNEIRGIIAYAADRGIRVMPEFDMPGHATAWVVSHPEIASAPGPYKIERRPGIFDPTLDPTNPATYALLKTFFEDMAKLFPDKYMHIGGDENEGKQWDANPKIQAFMKKNGIKDNHALQTYFNKQILPMLKRGGKTMMGWDEIFQPDLPKEVVIHSWRGQEALAKAAKLGYQGVLSNGYYIDLMQTAASHYVVDPVPANTTLTDAEQKFVLGGEATMWAEWVSPDTIDSRIWPRTAAIAERLWSAQNVNDVDDMYRRLTPTSRRLEELGLTHRKNQGMLVRRLTNAVDAPAVERFISYIEPVKGYLRYQVRPQTMLSPLTGLVDAALADAPGARSFNFTVANFIENRTDPQAAARLKSQLDVLETVRKDAAPIFDRSAGLFEGKYLLGELATLIAIAREASEAPRHSKPAEWRKEKDELLTGIKKAKASACEFAIVDAVAKLVEDASVK